MRKLQLHIAICYLRMPGNDMNLKLALGVSFNN